MNYYRVLFSILFYFFLEILLALIIIKELERKEQKNYWVQMIPLNFDSQKQSK